MNLTNPKTFGKWCEKNGFRVGAMLDDAERWASECDGSFGSRGFDYETGNRTPDGRIETIRFDLVRAEVAEVRNEKTGEIVGFLDFADDWTFGDECYLSKTISEAVYRFIG